MNFLVGVAAIATVCYVLSFVWDFFAGFVEGINQELNPPTNETISPDRFDRVLFGRKK